MHATPHPLKERLVSVYRHAAAPLARRHLRGLYDAGMPAALCGALAGLFQAHAAPDENQVAAVIERLRKTLADSNFEAAVYTGAEGYRRIGSRALAFRSSVDATWGRLLYRCARSMKARRILEVGASAGLSGCYLAASPCCKRFVTIEASAELALLARAHLAQIGAHAIVENGFVEAILDQALSRLEGAVDLVYLDAIKDERGMSACIDRLGPALRGGSLLIIDDIRWSPGCNAGWKAVQSRAEVTTSIDLGRFGLCIWRGDPGAPTQADLSRFLGWFRVHAGS